jgi:peptidyl-prolyl cis-trans isomerase C
MANIYTNPSIKEHPANPGAQTASYSGPIEPDTKVPPKAKPIMAEISVNGTAISETAILAEAQNHPSENPGMAVKKAARSLVIRELLVGQARKLDISVELETDENGRAETEDDALIRLLIDQEINVPLATDDDCERYYNNNRSKFRSETLFEARHILLAGPEKDTAAREKAKQKAEVLCKALQENPGDFSAAAAEYSACSSSGEGGRLGQIGQGDTVPAFEAALANMKDGDLVPSPVETEFGFHIIALDRRIEGQDLPFDHVKERIAAWLEASSWSKAVSQYISFLAGSAKITGIDLQESDGPLVQ